MFSAMQKHAIRNGLLIPEEEAVMPITVREVQQNFSVYEALRLVDGHVVHLDDHIRRLEASASMIGLRLPSAPWQDWIDLLCKGDGLDEATLRISGGTDAYSPVRSACEPLVSVMIIVYP